MTLSQKIEKMEAENARMKQALEGIAARGLGMRREPVHTDYAGSDWDARYEHGYDASTYEAAKIARAALKPAKPKAEEAVP